MKTTISVLLLFSIIFLQSFCVNKNHHDFKSPLPTPTSLDTLQGTWMSLNDSLHFLNISGRDIDEYFIDVNTRHIYYKLYFSDTLVNGEEFSFNEIKLNTTATTGKYLIKVGIEGDVWCYRMDGFAKEGNNTILSLADTWINVRGSLFIKQ